MKKCPLCNTENPNNALECEWCLHEFVVNCAGCGKDVVGKEYCSYCIQTGVYQER